MLDWLAANNPVVVNEGMEPTFHWWDKEGHIELTICSAGRAVKIVTWRVLSYGKNLSNHHCIEYEMLAHMR